MAKQTVIMGTELKLNVSINPIGDIHASWYNFTVDFFCSTKKVKSYAKEDLLPIDDDNFIALLDTTDVGAGELKCRITAYIPDSVTTIKSYAFTAGGISKLVIPENVSLIDYRAFYSLSTPSGLDGEVIVNGIPNIGNQAFYNVTPSVLQFTSEDGIPALLGSFSYFKGEGKIVVPDSLYDAWITSTNWSKYADQIIKKTDWDAQQTE